MSPEEFDVVYAELAAMLGTAEDRTVVRDRLILLALQRCTVAEARALIAQAGAVPDAATLRAPGDGAPQLDHTPREQVSPGR